MAYTQGQSRDALHTFARAIDGEARARAAPGRLLSPNYATLVGTHLRAGRRGTVGGKGPLCRRCEGGPENARSMCGPSSLAGACRQSDDLAKVMLLSPPARSVRSERAA